MTLPAAGSVPVLTAQEGLLQRCICALPLDIRLPDTTSLSVMTVTSKGYIQSSLKLHKRGVQEEPLHPNTITFFLHGSS